MLKSISKLILFSACISLLISSVYARNGLPYTFNSQESTKSSKLITSHIPGVGEVTVGGVKLLTEKQVAETPNLNINTTLPLLPETFSNRDSKYIRSLFNQIGGSCAQAGAVGFHYTYAINQARDTDASDKQNNCYPHLFTWNFLNGGVGGGSSFMDGWEICNEIGIPNYANYGTENSQTKWLSGYDEYFSGMKNRYVEPKKVDVSTAQGIENLKQWIHDRGVTGSTGGLATFSVNCLPPLWDQSPHTIPDLPSGTPQAGEMCVPFWGDSGGHVMTIVGWNDSVRLDLNDDGQYTNDIDINGDGVVNVGDWEIGGWLVLNTWGNWGISNNGTYWMLYRTGCLGAGNGYISSSSHDLTQGGLSTGKYVYTIQGRTVDDDITQMFAFKIDMTHSQRDQISLSAGVSNNVSDNTPEFSQRFIVFNYQGGDYPMQGTTNNTPIEIGLDVKHLLSHVDNNEAKFFLMIDAKADGAGQVNSFSLMDYRGTSPQEATCTETNKTIAASNTTIMSIVYTSATNPLNITTASLPNGTQNQAYTTTLEATGGKSPYVWELLENVYYETTSGSETWQITSTVSPNDTDDGYAEQDLGFSFPFFGETVDKIYIGTDGIILFEPNFVYCRSPKALQATKAIAGLGADYVIGTGDGMYFSGDANKAVIRWKTKHMWAEAGLVDIDVDFAVVLHKSGKIEYYYGSAMSGDVSGMAMGASNGEGSHFVFDYGSVSDIPSNHKSALLPEVKVAGMSANTGGVFSGTPTNSNGDYRVSFKVTDALEIQKTKSFNFHIGPVPIINKITNNIATPLTVINCANSSVIFSFATKQAADATLEAFTLDGKKIQTLFSGKLKAGQQKIVWNMKNESNQTLSNGVYLCKLSVGKENVVKKVAMFK